MRKMTVLLMVGALLLVNSSLYGGVEASAPPQLSTDAIKNADSVLRSKVAQSMVEEASKRGISIMADKIVYATRDDAIVANTGIVGIENLTEEQLAEGADVGFVYISLPNESGIAKGYYTLRVKLEPGATAGVSQLIDANGNVVKEAVAQAAQEAFVKIAFTVEIGLIYFCVDLHIRIGRIGIGIKVCWGLILLPI